MELDVFHLKTGLMWNVECGMLIFNTSELATTRGAYAMHRPAPDSAVCSCSPCGSWPSPAQRNTEGSALN